MKRYVFAVFWLFLGCVGPSSAGSEIGYVDDFSGQPNRYRVIHDGQEIAMRLCLPLYNDDTIEALDDKGRVSIRLIDHPEPVVWSRADKNTRLSVETPKASFWSELLGTTLAALSPFDEQKRERVLTTIRGDDGTEFSVPLFQSRQILVTGQRPVALGWLPATTIAEVSITDNKGRSLIRKSKASGGLWVSPTLSLKPGQYHLLVSAGATKVSGDIEVVDRSKIPTLPAELTQEGIPDSLSHTAQALWLAAQDGGQYRIEALQLVVNDRNTRSAAVLLETLIAGKMIELTH